MAVPCPLPARCVHEACYCQRTGLAFAIIAVGFGDERFICSNAKAYDPCRVFAVPAQVRGFSTRNPWIPGRARNDVKRVKVHAAEALGCIVDRAIQSCTGDANARSTCTSVANTRSTCSGNSAMIYGHQGIEERHHVVPDHDRRQLPAASHGWRRSCRCESAAACWTGRTVWRPRPGAPARPALRARCRSMRRCAASASCPVACARTAGRRAVCAIAPARWRRWAGSAPAPRPHVSRCGYCATGPAGAATWHRAAVRGPWCTGNR